MVQGEADEIVDPRPYCELMRQWSTFNPEFAFLPRKFKIAVIASDTDRAAMRLLVVLGFVTAFIGYAQFGVGFQAFSRTVAHISTQVLGWAYAANTAVIVVAQLFVLKFVAGRRRTRARTRADTRTSTRRWR